MSRRKRKERATKDIAPKYDHNKYTPYLSRLQEGTQNYVILKHMIDKGSISTYEAFIDHRITRLPARIWELKNMYGIDVTSERKVVKKKGVTESYSVYRLA